MELKQETKENIGTMSKWMNFNGIISIISGAIACLTCVGAIFGWAPIVLGVWSIKASKSFTDFAQTNNMPGMEEGFAKLKSINMLTGILTIIGLIFTVIYIIGMIIFFATVGTTMFQEIFKNLPQQY